MIDLPNDAEIAAILPYRAGERLLIASSGGHGFVVKTDEVYATMIQDLLPLGLRGMIQSNTALRRELHEERFRAAHPHVMKGRWDHDTLYLWEHQEKFAALLDAWEIANRNDIFNPVGLQRLPYIANSDFHKPKHIYSWKTLLHCEKDPEAIKACIRKNEKVSLTLYRDGISGDALRSDPRLTRAAASDHLPLSLALPGTAA